MKPGERIPLHDHRDINSGGKIDANASHHVVTSGGSGASGGGTGGGLPVQEDGAAVVTATTLNAGHGLDATDQGSGVAGLAVDESELEAADLGTAETDTSLVLAPDGAGGVEFRAETGGSGIPTTVGAPVTLYANAGTGNDVTGDGTVGAPYASIGRALADIPTVVTATFTVDVADGTYREQVNLDRFVFPTFNTNNPTGDARIILTGNTTTPANCIISGADAGAPTTPVRGFCIWATNAYVTIQGFKLQYASIRGLQASNFSNVRLGPMAYDNCGDGVFVGTSSTLVFTGNQTISNVAEGIYMFPDARAWTDNSGLTITMTGITDFGLHVVESGWLLNPSDTLSITAAGAGTRTAGIQADGNCVVANEGTVTVAGAFVYSVVAVGRADIHLYSATYTISGASTGAFKSSDGGAIWDGTTGLPIRVNQTVSFLSTGTPAGPVTGDRIWRTDLGREFFYDGTRWLSVGQHRMNTGHGTTAAISATTTALDRTFSPFLAGGSDIWIETFVVSFFVSSGGTALGASHNWAIALKAGRDATANTLDTVSTITINSGASGQDRRSSAAVGALLNNGTVHDLLQIDATKTGTPGDIQVYCEIVYRVVA